MSSIACPERRPPAVWWKIWDTSPFTPLQECGNWPDWIVSEWIILGIVILLLYLFIAWQVWQVRRRVVLLIDKDPKVPLWAFKWVSGFFIACGVSHALSPTAFVWPAYLLHIKWELVTAFTSAMGAWGVRDLVRWVVTRLATLEAERNTAIDKVVRAETILRQASTSAIPCGSPNRVLLDALITALHEDDK